MYTQSVHVFPEFFSLSQLYARRCNYKSEKCEGGGDANLLTLVGKDIASCNVFGCA
jgi:hypothetical protein